MYYELPYMVTSHRGKRIEISSILSFHSRPMFQWAVCSRVGTQPVFAFHVDMHQALRCVRECLDAHAESPHRRKRT